MIGIMVMLFGCCGRSPTEASDWDRLERDLEHVRSEYQGRLDAANTTVEMTEAALFGWTRLEDLLTRAASLRVAAGENAVAVEKEVADIKTKVLADGKEECANYEGGSIAAYVGGLTANAELAAELSGMIARRKENHRK